ncbi:MAG: SH3 domain-containing protein [Anaerolineae bacterium]|nr:SH3 domain-containing protein [Anaerolineae bacterium]MDW8098448.1 SH3 domain-containing protein [Anaerolineae bacterium]
MTDKLRSPSSESEEEEPQEETPEGRDLGPETELEATSEPRPVYGRPAERRLGREIPLWAVGVAALTVVAIIALLFSALGEGEPPGTPTPDATALAQAATATAMAVTPTPIPPTPTPTPVPKPTLGPGVKAMVVNSNPEGLVVRSGPGRGNPIRTVVRDGTVLEILPKPGDVNEYPVSADGYRWWRVRTETDLVGWVAQGDEVQLWLEPLSANPTPTRSPQ